MSTIKEKAESLFMHIERRCSLAFHAKNHAEYARLVAMLWRAGRLARVRFCLDNPHAPKR